MLHDPRRVGKERKRKEEKEPRSHKKKQCYQTISFSFKSDNKPAPNQISLKKKTPSRRPVPSKPKRINETNY